MTLASELFQIIEEFVSLSSDLELTFSEEQTLVSMDAAQWRRWRSLSVPPSMPAPSLLVRRLNYAIGLLRRMAAAPISAYARAGAAENRL